MNEQEIPWTTAPEHCETILESLPVEMSEQATEYARELAERYDGEFDNRPSTIAACAVYFAGKYYSQLVTQPMVGEPVGVSKVAVSHAWVQIANAEGVKVKNRATRGETFKEEGGSIHSRIFGAVSRLTNQSEE